jgi:hypothetical protein
VHTAQLPFDVVSNRTVRSTDDIITLRTLGISAAQNGIRTRSTEGKGMNSINRTPQKYGEENNDAENNIIPYRIENPIVIFKDESFLLSKNIGSVINGAGDHYSTEYKNIPSIPWIHLKQHFRRIDPSEVQGYHNWSMLF